MCPTSGSGIIPTNPPLCSCKCTATCPPNNLLGEYFENTCVCKPPGTCNRCPNGVIPIDANCTCKCANLCPSGYVKNTCCCCRCQYDCPADNPFPTPPYTCCCNQRRNLEDVTESKANEVRDEDEDGSGLYRESSDDNLDNLKGSESQGTCSG